MIKKSQKHADTIYKLAEIDDSEINIANAALNIGRLDYPSVDLNSYQKHLDEIAKTLEQQIKERSWQQRAAAKLGGPWGPASGMLSG